MKKVKDLTCCGQTGNMLCMNTTNCTGPFYLKTEKVQILLIKKRIKQVDLARQWGVTRSAVSRIIAGHAPYSPLLRKLATALSVPLQRITINQRP